MKTQLPGLQLMTALIAVAAATLPAGPRAQPAAAPALAFVGVNVVPMDQERILEDQTVIVQDCRIARIGAASSVTVPDGAQRLEASGRYLSSSRRTAPTRF